MLTRFLPASSSIKILWDWQAPRSAAPSPYSLLRWQGEQFRILKVKQHILPCLLYTDSWSCVKVWHQKAKYHIFSHPHAKPIITTDSRWGIFRHLQRRKTNSHASPWASFPNSSSTSEPRRCKRRRTKGAAEIFSHQMSNAAYLFQQKTLLCTFVSLSGMCSTTSISYE